MLFLIFLEFCEIFSTVFFTSCVQSGVLCIPIFERIASKNQEPVQNLLELLESKKKPTHSSGTVFQNIAKDCVRQVLPRHHAQHSMMDFKLDFSGLNRVRWNSFSLHTPIMDLSKKH